MLNRLWISKRSRWNAEKKESESYFETEIVMKDTKTSFECTIPEDVRKKIMELILPCLRQTSSEFMDKISEELQK